MPAYNRDKTSAVFIDIPDLYARLADSGLVTHVALRNLVIEQFDLSALSQYLSGSESAVWAFYSDNGLGGPGAPIEGQDFKDLVTRLNSQTGVTALNVEDSRVGPALLVHLFDTMDAWDEAFIVSGSNDMVPAVRALRRRGKLVKCAGLVKDAPAALVRECFSYIDLEAFFVQSLYIQKLFDNVDGVLEKTLAEHILKSPKVDTREQIIDRGFPIILNVQRDASNSKTILTLHSEIIDWPSVDIEAPVLPQQPRIARDQLDIFFDPCFYETLRDAATGFAARHDLVKQNAADNSDATYVSYIAKLKWNGETQRYERETL